MEDYTDHVAIKQHKKYMKQDSHYRELTKEYNRANRDAGFAIASLFFTALAFIYFMAEFEASEATDGRYDSWLLLPLGVVLLVIYTSYRCFIYASELTSQREQEQRKYRRKLEEKESEQSN